MLRKIVFLHPLIIFSGFMFLILVFSVVSAEIITPSERTHGIIGVLSFLLMFGWPLSVIRFIQLEFVPQHVLHSQVLHKLGFAIFLVFALFRLLSAYMPERWHYIEHELGAALSLATGLAFLMLFWRASKILVQEEIKQNKEVFQPYGANARAFSFLIIFAYWVFTAHFIQKRLCRLEASKSA
ncbi:hypothetical protein [Emcibacter sp.]|uniref:hypothetical protein n=1 Tax=Emcibacter sp. TaxID=1979954 RepID=UPI002AA8C56D|nr:hypothetical protein [Emcibacter sp.]